MVKSGTHGARPSLRADIRAGRRRWSKLPGESGGVERPPGALAPPEPASPRSTDL